MKNVGCIASGIVHFLKQISDVIHSFATVLSNKKSGELKKL